MSFNYQCITSTKNPYSQSDFTVNPVLTILMIASVKYQLIKTGLKSNLSCQSNFVKWAIRGLFLFIFVFSRTVDSKPSIKNLPQNGTLEQEWLICSFKMVLNSNESWITSETLRELNRTKELSLNYRKTIWKKLYIELFYLISIQKPSR